MKTGWRLTSALGQKQTCAAQNGMSALPLKADIGCVLDYRSVGDAAVTATPVYARDTHRLVIQNWLAAANADACL